MKRKIVVFLSVIMVMILSIPFSARAEKVLWDAITSGGIIASSSGASVISSSVGQPAVERVESSINRVYSGFWNPWLIGSVGTDFDIPSGLPLRFQLHQSYPNPFQIQTTIHYDIVRASHVTLEIFDLLGHRVRVLTDVPHEPGFYTVNWDGKNASHRRVGSGVYFCRMRTHDSAKIGFSATNELLLLK